MFLSAKNGLYHLLDVLCKPHGNHVGFPDGPVRKDFACSAGDAGDLDSIPGSRRSPGEGNGRSNILACKSPMDRGAWWATVHVVAEPDTTQ